AANRIDNVELRQAPWFEPVADERFDRIVANPPFVVGLPEVGHVYRDSGLSLDGATELVVGQAPAHLAEGATACILGAWVHRTGESWRSRVAS
ncbi:rRNA methyltransferase, partial [Clostridium perfringens]